METNVLGRLALITLFFLLPLLARAQQQPPGNPLRIVRGGVAIEFRMQPVEGTTRSRGEFREGDTVNFRFRITDIVTDKPLSGLYPAAWMDLRPETEGEEGSSCEKKVERFLGGSLFAQPELDLNTYYVLALNSNPTITVVDPRFGFGDTKLLAMILLDSPGEDWALTSDQMTLYVSMPKSDKVAVASTTTWKINSNLPVGTRPSRIALQSDERYLWVAFDGNGHELSGVTVIDTDGSTVVKTILTGRGHHEIAFAADDRHAFVTNRGDGTLSVIDVSKLTKVTDVAVGKDPVSLAYSPVAGAVYVTSRADGVVTAVDGKSHKAVASMQTKAGLGQIRFAPGGRLGFVVNTDTDVIHIVDAALNRIIQTGNVQDGPDQVAFSDKLAYVRHRNSEIVLMIPLDEIGVEGQPVPVMDFPGGQHAFGSGRLSSLADGIVPAPGANAVLVANPADKAIYFYKEGMAAPMGMFRNYDREPRAVLTVDRSLKERSPGAYETTATLRRPGRYDVAFFLDSPRIVHCFKVKVVPDPERKRVEAQLIVVDRRAVVAGKTPTLQVGNKTTLGFKLIDFTTKQPRTGLPDVEVLISRSPFDWRKSARHVGDGVYEIDFVPPEAGLYHVFVQSLSVGLRLTKTRSLMAHNPEPPK